MTPTRPVLDHLPPRPGLQPTTFPDAAVADAVDELLRAAERLEAATEDRAAAMDGALATWQGRCAELVAIDHGAGQRAATILAADLRALAASLQAAAEDAADLRRRRRTDHEAALADWRRRLAATR